jgi:hypothetical protein
MKGTTCPDLSSDLNADGFIDISEATQLSGKILIPLDSNLSEQFTGIDFGPIANSYGSYIYRRSTGFSTLMSDLYALDPDPSDFITKLNVGEMLNLSGKVVLIHGVRKSDLLTDQVTSMRGLSTDETLPIACGTLMKLSAENIESGI